MTDKPDHHFDHIHWAMNEGGRINEPVVGMGLNTGKSYVFGERGPEAVRYVDVPSDMSLFDYVRSWLRRRL